MNKTLTALALALLLAAGNANANTETFTGSISATGNSAQDFSVFIGGINTQSGRVFDFSGLFTGGSVSDDGVCQADFTLKDGTTGNVQATDTGYTTPEALISDISYVASHGGYSVSNVGNVTGTFGTDKTPISGTFKVNELSIQPNENGYTGSATFSGTVSYAGGAVRIPHIASIVKYSFTKIGNNAYNFNFVGKNIDGRFTYEKIKWGGTQEEMEQREWQRYQENNNIVHTDSDEIHFWVRNGDGTGHTLTINLITGEVIK